MTAKKLAIAAFFLLCIFALASGNVLHAVIPHDDTHGEAMWSILHTALRHDDKKALLLLALALVYASAFLLCARLALVLVAISRARPALVEKDPPQRHESLRRGIVAYRKFR